MNIFELCRRFIADAIATLGRLRVSRSTAMGVNRERRTVRALSRLGRGEGLDFGAVVKLKEEGFRFAALWRLYRLSPNLVTESRLLNYLRNLVGADLALAFFVRSEALIPKCLASRFPDFVEAELSDLPEHNLIEVFEFKGSSRQGGRLFAIESGGERSVDVEIRTRGKDALYRLDDVTVFGGSGIIRKESQAFWPNYTFEASGDGLYPWDSVLVEHTSGRAILRRNFLETPNLVIDQAVSLLDSSARHFGHFVWGLVPRLRVLFGEKKLPTGLKILVGDETPPNLIDFLTQLGVKSRVVTVPKGESVKVKHLYVSSQLKYFPDIMPETAEVETQSLALAAPEFEFLFSLEGRTVPKQGRISLLRNGTGEGPWRKCLNHDEVEETLSNAGIVNFSSKIDNPIALYSSLRESSLIVVDDGSISANVLLAGVTGAKIIFLTHPGISAGSHLEWWTQGYLAYSGNQVFSMHVNVLSIDRTSDWWVDCDRLRQLVTEVEAYS